MKSVIILSGGLDSTVLLNHRKRKGDTIIAVSFDYGQRHIRELVHARKVARVLEIEHHIISLSNLRPIFSGSSQTDFSVPVPHGHYAEESMKKTIVPNRNMIMLSIAGAIAISHKYDALWYAAHAGDHAIYPDCRKEFVDPLREALVNADWHQVGILAPFLTCSKSEIVKLGFQEQAPLDLTYSCYEGRDFHCGECGTCTERIEAFKDAHVEDPTLYVHLK